MFRLCPSALVAFAVLTLVAPSSGAQTREATREEITASGTVTTIDRASRTVTVVNDQGTLVTVDAPPDAKRFEALQVGDVITVTYFDRVSIRPKPADEPPVDRMIPPTTTPAPGDLPGGTRATQRTVTVTLTGWDPTNRVVAFNGPGGASYTRRLLDSTDASILAGLKPGDRVDVTWTSATQITVSRDELRHRFTVSLLWGWDNSFSGKMIENAIGRTTTGTAIYLTKTSYDDVYGRMGLLKIGGGYRTSPRTEAVFNFFVFSKSDAERVSIGSVATQPATKLTVDFTPYKYWGLEGGQRWFFTRERFTPYAGYLVGVNRHRDIRGTFVGVPASATPGLAAQDGKFFERSWAFSFGPTGGVLVGVGPVEVIVETQLRFLGGLSDVDWLVEEGLKDINSESSRWSIPVMFGVRYRF